MGVVHKKFEGHFTQIFNICFYDKRLEWCDLAVYSQLCSMPDNWAISIRKLNSLHSKKNHKNSIANSLNNLISYGYLRRVKPEKQMDKTGKYEKYDYELYASPFDNPHVSIKKIPEELKKTYYNFMNLNYSSPVPTQDRSASPEKTGPVPIEDSVNTSPLNNGELNIDVALARFEKAIAVDRERLDEACRTKECSNKAVKFAEDSFKCFGEEQVRKICLLDRKDYVDLFNAAYDLANETEFSEGVHNPKKFFSHLIKSCTRKIKN